MGSQRTLATLFFITVNGFTSAAAFFIMLLKANDQSVNKVVIKMFTYSEAALLAIRSAALAYFEPATVR
jgi:hypothetical protein